MRKIYSVLLATILAFTIVGCEGKSSGDDKATSVKAVSKVVKKMQDVQVFSVANADGTITPKTIEAAFDATGLTVDGNNNMNKPFSQRFPKLHYKEYFLAMFRNNDLTLKLVKKYDNFGALTPLTMSIWSDGKTMNISTLSINGMSRAAEIPLDDKDLIAYAKMIDTALKAALPNGSYKDLGHVMTHNNKSLATSFEMEIEEDVDLEEFKEDFQAEFEGEMEPLGFLMPNFVNLKEEIFDDAGYDGYDFYDTYSICKFDVIYPVHVTHPEAGAWAPCSFYMYKKKDVNVMRMGFLSVDNWVTTMNIEDDASLKPLRAAQGMITDIINELTE
ncbi:hypothetical protein JHD48_10435 [Sulfurimonas sp. SAG-AH-194-I05]|nr:hypothetical protein [Sulfurimonas sp. SAG-AH-194-I05]MDF1876149.1 hypothetical protein [Sulfurimonas sp. SAG-AH-194-I05]